MRRETLDVLVQMDGLVLFAVAVKQKHLVFGGLLSNEQHEFLGQQSCTQSDRMSYQ